MDFKKFYFYMACFGFIAIAVWGVAQLIVLRYEPIGIVSNGSFVYVLDRMTGRVCVSGPPPPNTHIAFSKCIPLGGDYQVKK